MVGIGNCGWRMMNIITWKLEVLKKIPTGRTFAFLLPNHSLMNGWEILIGTGRLIPPRTDLDPSL